MPHKMTISIIENKDKILLKKRDKGFYAGMLSLPGGRIENGETIEECVKRKVKEDTNMEGKFHGVLGVVLEKLMEGKKVKGKFLIFLCKLVPEDGFSSISRDCSWHSVSNLEKNKTKIVPSDYEMINRIFMKENTGYYEAVVVKNGDSYNLQSFEKVTGG